MKNNYKYLINAERGGENIHHFRKIKKLCCGKKELRVIVNALISAGYKLNIYQVAWLCEGEDLENIIQEQEKENDRQ